MPTRLMSCFEFVLIAGIVVPSAAAQSQPASAATQTQPTSAPSTQSQPAEPEPLSAETLAGLKLRLVGPALMAGRIADIAVNPNDCNEYYLAVASGGVWKTSNAGVTWTPVFDGEGSYSIGCVTIDPRNPFVVWVGTGENNSQRSVGWGDGVYRSRDGGKNWENLGLKESEHIGMIAIDPRDSNVVYVAAQGPLWRGGGDRGLYKTVDGGKTWQRVLHVSDDTGINEVHLDPRNPDVLYASAYQRRRHVWTLINGGPESALYKSEDGGATWRKINKGLPEVDLGRIGLDIAPANPDVLYAIVEAADGKGGVFRSTNRGETWEKRCDYMTTSGQYYNEIICDPLEVDHFYAMDTFLHVTDDGGKTMRRVIQQNRHVDDHALWINPRDTRHLRIGCDGGLYESFDRGETWRFFANLPITQFYRINVDNSEPFYYVYGGTQDNSTVGAPSRTIDRIGIANEHWFLTVGGDGYETVVDPLDQNIVYSLWQYGGLVRHDRRSGETIDIKPTEKPGEEPLRWNWDSPLILSPHDHKRLYFAANKLFRSDDQGDSWIAVSGDLTRRIDRNQLPVFGRLQSVDAVAKNASTSFYGNIVSLDESPLVAGLLYIGTDDGLIQVSEDGGRNWRKQDTFPGVPDGTYVSCLRASRHAANVVYAAFDNHKQGDFKPYLFKSADRGRTWSNVAGDLPARDTVYTLVEDHVKPDLLICGTEFGAYVTIDGGGRWMKLKGGLPTISVRDLEIQRRENDLIVGTFGRSIYILDDYSPLRLISKEALEKDVLTFPMKPALRYVESNRLGGRNGRGTQGSAYYSAPNPPFGAVFTYYLKEKQQTRKERRQEQEKKDLKEGRTLRYPTYQELRAEDEEKEPLLFVEIRDEAGELVDRVPAPRDKGIQRVAWNLRYPSANPVSLAPPEEGAPWDEGPVGHLALPGAYTATLVREVDGVAAPLGEPQKFEVRPLPLATFAAKDLPEAVAFLKKVARLQRAVTGAQRAAGEADNRLAHLRKAILDTPGADRAIIEQVTKLQLRLREITVQLNGDPTLNNRNEPAPTPIADRVFGIIGSQWRATSPPTKTEREQYELAGAQFATQLAALRTLIETDLARLEATLETAGAPWTPGRVPRWESE
jgi:photosystem II stability/assembly factor-like uncharacterized protein